MNRGISMIFEIVVVGPLEVNCFILGCESTKEGIIVDPGADPEKILAVVNRLGLTVRQVINTHGHFDHVGGNRRVLEATGAELLIHGGDVPFLSRAADVARMYGLTYRQLSSPGTPSGRWNDDRFRCLRDDCSPYSGTHSRRLLPLPSEPAEGHHRGYALCGGGRADRFSGKFPRGSDRGDTDQADDSPGRNRRLSGPRLHARP